MTTAEERFEKKIATTSAGGPATSNRGWHTYGDEEISPLKVPNPFAQQLVLLTQEINRLRCHFEQSEHSKNVPPVPLYRSCFQSAVSIHDVKSNQPLTQPLHHQQNPESYLTRKRILEIEKAYERDHRTLHEIRVLNKITEQPQNTQYLVDKRLRYLAKANSLAGKLRRNPLPWLR
jgi:ribosomal protein S15P/S13E